MASKHVLPFSLLAIGILLIAGASIADMPGNRIEASANIARVIRQQDVSATDANVTLAEMQNQVAQLRSDLTNTQNQLVDLQNQVNALTISSTTHTRASSSADGRAYSSSTAKILNKQ